MKSNSLIATAIRRKDGTIELKKSDFISLVTKKRFLNIPIVRGFISLIEMMTLGMKTLQFSVDRAMLDEENSKNKNKLREKLENFASWIFSLGIAFLLFVYMPYKLSEISIWGNENTLFNILAGVFRVTIFLCYLLVISLLKDVKILFQYHGAEHKTINTYEKKENLTIKNVLKSSRFNPRCGTSFIFLVLMISIFVFSFVDSLVALKFGRPVLYIRISYHMLLVPFISGISFEILKFSDRNQKNIFVKLLIKPGLWIQKITTSNPTNEQAQVAIVALKAVLGQKNDEKVVLVD